LQILSDLLISRGINPATLEKHKRCEICRENGPGLHEGYECSEGVCRDLWGELASPYWKTPASEEKKDIKELFRDRTKTFLNAVLGRSKR
jgi:hypothetical protein